jgi:2-polyprenyl-3-methyl-5-hydroxy-6-metoxy-1,4-benzoquinol methylase
VSSRWSRTPETGRGSSYAARFDRLAASGQDVHGEATFCAGLVPPGSRILDAGCGTGRVALRLAEIGYDCTGVDLDEDMLQVAKERGPHLPWVAADLASGELPTLLGNAEFDLVVAAGNVFPFLAEGTEPVVVANLAALLRPGGLLVAGFGLDARHLPATAAQIALPSYDALCADAGLILQARYATWGADPYEGGGYAVSVHRLG